MARTKAALRQLPDATLSPDQFETLGDGTIGLIGFENIGSGSSDPDAADPTVSLIGRNLSFIQETWPNDLEYRENGGTPIGYISGNELAVGDDEVAADYFQARVKAVTGSHKASAWVGNDFIPAAGSGEYNVERRISLDLQGEFGSDITGDPLDITWNTWKPTNAQIQVDGGAVKSALVTEANVATAIGVVNVGGWSGNSGSTGGATGTPAYPLSAINGGFTLQTTDVGIKFTGANPTKFYQVYVLAADSEANAAVDITAGGNTINKVTTNNYPPNGTDRYAPTQLAKFYNIVPNGSGEFTISFHKTGSYYQVSVSLILIEESNIAKP